MPETPGPIYDAITRARSYDRTPRGNQIATVVDREELMKLREYLGALVREIDRDSVQMVRLWVDFDGFKFKVNEWPWMPPIGSVQNIQ